MEKEQLQQKTKNVNMLYDREIIEKENYKHI